jgi:hypothetical protein
MLTIKIDFGIFYIDSDNRTQKACALAFRWMSIDKFLSIFV